MKPKPIGYPLMRELRLLESLRGNRQHVPPITIVAGPPGSGKTTYVRQHAVAGDLILDVDAIFHALSGLPWYGKPEALLPFVLSARDAVMVRLRQPNSIRMAWLIASAPTREDRAQLKISLKTTVLVLAVPAVECLARIAADPRRADTLPSWHELIFDWWRVYEPEVV